MSSLARSQTVVMNTNDTVKSSLVANNEFRTPTKKAIAASIKSEWKGVRLLSEVRKIHLDLGVNLHMLMYDEEYGVRATKSEEGFQELGEEIMKVVLDSYSSFMPPYLKYVNFREAEKLREHDAASKKKRDAEKKMASKRKRGEDSVLEDSAQKNKDKDKKVKSVSFSLTLGEMNNLTPLEKIAHII